MAASSSSADFDMALEAFTNIELKAADGDMEAQQIVDKVALRLAGVHDEPTQADWVAAWLQMRAEEGVEEPPTRRARLDEEEFEDIYHDGERYYVKSVNDEPLKGHMMGGVYVVDLMNVGDAMPEVVGGGMI